MREIRLPLSKSVVARLAMMAAVSGGKMPDPGGSEDGEVIIKALTEDGERIDVRGSGTAARFALACYGSRRGVKIVDGNEQLRQRPVGAIVKAMRSLGAKIDYLGFEGRLPVRIDGCGEIGSEVEADAGESSQTISALMLIGAGRGMRIKLKGDIVSQTYIELTRKLMEKAGVVVKSMGNVIEVHKGKFGFADEIDRDWSSAVFWYGMVAVGEEDELLLKGLKMGSGQPDERVVKFYEELGVGSKETLEGVIIHRVRTQCVGFYEDCKGCPDMVPVLAATLCRRGIRFTLCGLETLERKESRRGSIMVREMGKLGYRLEFDGEKMWWNGERCRRQGLADVADDHRIAMALIVAGAEIGNTECINKSYKGIETIWKKA
ncbi:MAG: hypothetical protein MJ002_02430 [Paludibacteraceae bacterium]|nr:hypothetical protein [Paludibacteraceae bacterium]